MHVTRLWLKDFRSYPEADVLLQPGVTALVGRNGQGKTNLVEAIGYVATLGSHRVATDAPLVRTGAQSAVVRATVDRDGRETLVELEIVPGRANRARLNRSPATRPRDVLGALRTVLFAPEDLALVKGDPDGRRRFLDEVLVALAPRLAGVRADYERVLRQRNALLRTAGGARGRGRGSRPAAGAPGGDGAEEPSTLEVWDTHLATAGAELLFARLHLVRRIAPHVADAYQRVSGSDPATGSPAGLGYRCSVPEVDALDLTGDEPLPGRADLARVILAAIAEQRGAELERGTSLVGPHRDDLVLALDRMPARGYASHGESWSYALALRLGSYALLRGTPVQRTPLVLPAPGGPAGDDGPAGEPLPGQEPGQEPGQGVLDVPPSSPVAGPPPAAPAAPAPARGGDPEDEPVLILDDVFAELDAGRRTRLAALVADAEQVIVTAAVDDDVPAGLGGARLHVQRGEVRPGA